MRRKLWRLPFLAPLLLCMVLLPGCVWFKTANTFVLNVEYSDDTSSYVLSVSGAPEQGVAGIFVAPGALRYNTDAILVAGIHGASDFTILSHRFDNVVGEVSFIAVNPTRGIRSGSIAVISVVSMGEGDPNLVLDPAGVHLVDAYNGRLEGFVIRCGK